MFLSPKSRPRAFAPDEEITNGTGWQTKNKLLLGGTPSTNTIITDVGSIGRSVNDHEKTTVICCCSTKKKFKKKTYHRDDGFLVASLGVWEKVATGTAPLCCEVRATRGDASGMRNASKHHQKPRARDPWGNEVKEKSTRLVSAAARNRFTYTTYCGLLILTTVWYRR